jgi:hypothetical protein
MMQGQAKTAYRMQCQSCLSATRWRGTKEEAAVDWNTRQHTGAAPSPAIIIDDLFYWNGAVYARHPKTGTYWCNTVSNDKASKGKRIARKRYLEALEKCREETE